MAERSVRVSDPPRGQPALSDVVLGFRTEVMPDGPDAFKTFQAGSARVHPAAGDVFAGTETVHCVFQLLSPDPSHELKFAFLPRAPGDPN